MPVDVTLSNMTATCGGVGSAKVVQVLDCPAGIVCVNGVMPFLVLEEPVSLDGRQQFIPPLIPMTLMRQLGANIRPLTPITLMRQSGANIRMKESGDVLEIEDDRGTIHAEALVRERSGHVHNQLDFFPKDGWTLRASLRDPFIAHNRHQGSPYGKYEFKRDHQTKFVPTAECLGLEVLESVNPLFLGWFS